MELIWSARDNVNSEVSDGLRNSCFFNNIKSLHHNEFKYQGEAILILCAMGAHGLQPEVEFSIFLALQISNAVSQTLDSNKEGAV